MDYDLSPFDDLSFESALSSVNHTLASQSQALASLRDVYDSDAFARSQLEDSMRILHTTTHVKRGKIVVCGVGKLYKIGLKLVATFNSLSIHAQGLHPTEALHGDLGLVNESRDCIIFITASGNTPELLQLLPHLDRQIPIVLLTSNKNLKLALHLQISSLLYAPLSVNEEDIHGLPAPTVLATLALVLADAVILALLEIIEADLPERRRRFSTKHPGGAIGADLSHLNSNYMTSVLNGSSLSSLLDSSYLSLGKICNYSLTSPAVDTFSPCPAWSSGFAMESPDLDLSKAIGSAPALVVGRIPRDEIITVLDTENELQLLKWIAQFEYLVFQEKDQSFGIAVKMLREEYSRYTAAPSWKSLHQNILSLFKVIV